MIFEFFDHQFHSPARTIDMFINECAMRAQQVGGDKAGIGALFVVFGFDNHPVWIVPGTGLIGEFTVNFDWFAAGFKQLSGFGHERVGHSQQ